MHVVLTVPSCNNVQWNIVLHDLSEGMILTKPTTVDFFNMMTSSNGNIFRVIGPLCGEFTAHTGQWRGALMFSIICAWTNVWANHRDASELRRHHPHYDVNVLYFQALGLKYHYNDEVKNTYYYKAMSGQFIWPWPGYPLTPTRLAESLTKHEYTLTFISLAIIEILGVVEFTLQPNA